MTPPPSPLPWKVVLDKDMHRSGRIYEIRDAEGIAVVETDCGFYAPSETDANFIVEAVNNYQILLSRLRQLEAQNRRYREALEKANKNFNEVCASHLDQQERPYYFNGVSAIQSALSEGKDD